MTTLIHLAANGDHAAFAALITPYRPQAMRVAQQILRTKIAAEDAVQDAMIKVWRALPDYQDGNFRSWLLRIVTNTCLDRIRRDKHLRVLSLDQLIEDSVYGDAGFLRDDAPPLIDGVIRDETMSELLVLVDTLPWYHRDVVLMVDVQGMDYEEAAQREGVPLGTVKSRLSRGRATLRERIIR